MEIERYRKGEERCGWNMGEGGGSVRVCFCIYFLFANGLSLGFVY